MIYLDHNATTPVAPEVIDAMVPLMAEDWGNPSSVYTFARRARAALDKAREEVASLLGADPEEVVFTSCGTESINTAIRSAVASSPGRPLVLVSTVEHSACWRAAEAAVGTENVLRLRVDGDGLYDFVHLAELLAEHGDRLAVASLMWANNETGVLPGIEEAVGMLVEAGVPVHVDAVQAAGKVLVDMGALPVDFLSISGHKIHAPKGVGALCIRRGRAFKPLLVGGGQEGGRRSGTEPVPMAAALGAACRLAKERLAAGKIDALRARRDRFEQRLLALPGTHRNGHADHRTPNTANLRFDGVAASVALVLLDDLGVACSSGSACKASSGKPSPVLKAMGLTDQQARESFRFSLATTTTDAEVDEAAGLVEEAVRRVREASAPRPGSRVIRRSR